MANLNLKSSLSMESKQKMLKDFLNNDSTNDFGTYPQKPCRQTVQNHQSIVLKRSKSRASTSAIAAINKASEIVIKTLKYFPFASLKFPSTLPRSISSKFSSVSRRKDRDDNQRDVKVKDILRWRSSRDLVEEESTPLDLLYSPSRCTINTTTSGSTSCTSEMTSNSSSWCESDFSAEDFPSWCFASEHCYGENEVKMANKKRFSPRISVGEGIMEKTMDEAEEQYTPVSVLVSPFQENEESNYPCRFGNTQSMSQGNQGNEAEEKAKKLLHHLKETTLPNSYDSYMENNLLMDFFWEELPTHQNDENKDFPESQLIASAQDWLKGVHALCFEWKVESKRENYIKEMEKGLRWNKHEEEKEEIALQLEKIVLNGLVDEVIFGFIAL
ncbi:hypothetical protein LIER_16350 [Lithospermum erythrorhizon]|uniref:DUF4378 domain-containing protein n=1 Tax=Lithospermum erythrorhizon TaxID=34254 RepID=A0AAV3Q8W5_LITER